MSLIQQSTVDYRNGILSLNGLVNRVEAIGNVIGGEIWDKQIFEIVLDLERVNSEIIDKARQITPHEHEIIEVTLRQLDIIVASFQN